jgi:polysaccharide pyruvyl transferase WcaK-like protein
MFYANGIGPLKKRLNRLLTKKIMNQVDVITLREKLSFEELRQMDIGRPRILLTADAALTTTDFKDGFDTGVLEFLNLNKQKPLLGISFRKYPGHDRIVHEKYETVIAKAIDHMIDEYGVHPVFFPMQHPEDIPILENVAAQMHGKGTIVTEKLNVCQTYDHISKMDMILGMRLHSLVFSAIAAVPMLGLVYDPKIQGFLDYIGQPSAGDVRHLEYDNLISLSDMVWNDREAISRQLKVTIPELEEKARENARVAVELINSAPR